MHRTPLNRYSVSVLAVALAYGLTVAIEPFFSGKAPLVFFILAALLSAGYGGRGPGLLATGMGSLLVFLFFDRQAMVFSVAHASLVIFAILGIGISLMMGYFQKKNMALSNMKTSLESANDELSRRTEDLSRANEELQRFAYAVAHDLSAPLRGISTLTDLLIKRNADQLDESSKKCADMILSKTDRMMFMIKGLLDYAAAAERTENRTLVDCNAAVKMAMSDLDAVIKESGAQITVGVLPSVRAINTQLEQVFANLISNAIKYRSIDQPPRIDISSAEKAQNWLFCVSDNGIGIDMKYAHEIFGMFRRLHRQDQYEGSGIGLALCKVIMHRHGGDIWVESETGKGSRFFFTFPKTSQAKQVESRQAAKAVAAG